MTSGVGAAIDFLAHVLCDPDGKILPLFAELFDRARILVQVTIYRRHMIGRDGHLDQS